MLQEEIFLELKPGSEKIVCQVVEIKKGLLASRSLITAVAMNYILIF